MIKTAKTLNEWKVLALNLRGEEPTSGSLGFVPTMGALHQGHAELIKKSKTENAKTVVSIYVNPTQFDNPVDYNKYPSDLEADLQLLSDLRVDALFLPSYKDLYPDHYKFKVSESEVSQTLCGAHRQGHFDGVLTVVMKLLNIVSPNRAYFGEKDFQQLYLIKNLVEAFFINTEIIGLPTVREADGLALSSRNKLLSPEQRKLAPQLKQFLSSNKKLEEIKFELSNMGWEVDYIEEKFGRRFIAAKIGNVRLIDNVQI